MADLYFFTGTDPDDFRNDRSLAVSADTPEEAFEYWRRYNWEVDADDFATHKLPLITTDTDDDEVINLWRIKHDPAVKGAIDWFGENCEWIGYFEPTED